jgi:hypothetical protein
MEDTRSDLCVRERATIKERPALASQAERVRSISLLERSIFLESLRESMTNPIKRDIKRSSRHRRAERR